MRKLHGYSRSKIYKTWLAMKYRCYDQKYCGYKNYGGKGIKVCDRWLHSFQNFLEDMDECPNGKSLDRIDNSNDYCKENCRWSTKKEQQRNRSCCHFVEAFGKRQPISVWAEEMGLKHCTILFRLKKNWPIEIALTRTIMPGKSIKLKEKASLHCSTSFNEENS